MSVFPLDDPSALNASQRRRHLAAMTSETFDVVVVGGGITGVGAALDAASRGLRVALVEQRDYASGTSSRSSKMFHGGLRYLEQFDFGLVREALRERNLMLNLLCPHLVRPTSFVYPLRRRFSERIYVGAGVLIYEILSRLADSPLPWHSHLGAEGLREICPDLSAIGAVRYWDAVVDDARHTMTVARTASAHGALLASSVRLVGVEESDGRITAVTVTDLEDGDSLSIDTRTVINATGVWTDNVEALAGEEGTDVQASKGVHLLVPRDRIRSETGIILRTDASVLFVIPWERHWIVGTTDTPWTLGRAHPAASRSDIDYLLRWVNTAIETPLSTDDIVGVYAGLRPLLKGESEQTSKLSRQHAVVDRGNGMVSVAGGKYTTYRVMAADAVDALEPYLDEPLGRSRTDAIPLVGATTPLDERIHSRYGSLKTEIGESIAAKPHYGAPVVADAPYLLAEIAYAVTHEGALHLDDVLTRRTRLSIETSHRGVAAAPPAAAIMAQILGWDEETIRREIDHYEARVRAEVDSQQQPDDHTADAARMGAPDVRTGRSE
ncbi:MAG TPA: glycerol-3-phosphate dehydrogenase/oxidase [Acidimicrobiia bacterium]|nr:glycerol-3-phosphate dehydrogenase/oxidase [Acidimicrobiia bacterium]